MAQPRKSHPMIVSGGGIIMRHYKNGRQLNVMKDSRQASTRDLWSDEFESKLSAYNIADYIVKEFRSINKVRQPTVDLLARLVLWLVFNPHEYLKINHKHIKLNSRTITKVIEHLESNNYIVALAGWTKKLEKKSYELKTDKQGYQAIPMVITATDKLLNLKINSK